jgi:hypothetical protein
LVAQLLCGLAADEFDHQATRPHDFVAGFLVVVLVAPFLSQDVAEQYQEFRALSAYTDGAGARRTKQFAKKSAGEAWLVETCHDVARGIHTPGSISPTVKEAGALWIKRCKEKQLEAMTIKGYKEHCELHIYPFIGTKKLSDLTVPAVNGFSDQLRGAGRSAEMIKKIIGRSALSSKRSTRANTTTPPPGREFPARRRPSPTTVPVHQKKRPQRMGAH